LTAFDRVTNLHSVADVSIIACQRVTIYAAETLLTGFKPVANVSIIANKRLAALTALNGIATFLPVTQVAVVANQRLAVSAACCGVAGFDAVADVTIATLQSRSPEAFSVNTLVLNSTDVAVVAGEIIVRVHAPGLGCARIFRARVSIVAIDSLPVSTHSLCANVVHRALVAIRAQPSFIRRREVAEAIRWVAYGVKTRGIDAVRFGAHHCRIGLEHALERNLLVVAHQLAYTEVLFESCAVCILQAVA